MVDILVRLCQVDAEGKRILLKEAFQDSSKVVLHEPGAVLGQVLVKEIVRNLSTGIVTLHVLFFHQVAMNLLVLTHS